MALITKQRETSLSLLDNAKVLHHNLIAHHYILVFYKKYHNMI